MEEVKVWLSSNGLGEYWPNFEKHGWEELSLLSEMSEVELEVCITKAGHRAKFRKALRSLTNASASSGNSESPSHADKRQKFPCEMGAMPVANTEAIPSLTQRTETLTQLGRAESGDASPKEDDAESMETVRKSDTGPGQIDAVHEVDNTGTDSADTIQEIDKADSEAIVRDVKDALRIADDNRTETEPDVTIQTTNEVSRFEESGTASRSVTIKEIISLKL